MLQILVKSYYNYLITNIYIFVGYFTDECSEDLATMREGIKLSRRLASSESFAKYKGEEVFPGNHIQTDDELDEYIRNVSLGGSFHFRIVL